MNTRYHSTIVQLVDAARRLNEARALIPGIRATAVRHRYDPTIPLTPEVRSAHRTMRRVVAELQLLEVQ